MFMTDHVRFAGFIANLGHQKCVIVAHFENPHPVLVWRYVSQHALVFDNWVSN